MAFEELMGLSNRLLTNAQALAALTARLRLDDLGIEGDPSVRAELDRVVDALGAREHVQELGEGERSVVLSFALVPRPGAGSRRESRPGGVVELRRSRAARGAGVGLRGGGTSDRGSRARHGGCSVLALAREKVTSAGLDGRITLLNQTVQELEDPDGFDLVWLPSFFIPEPVLDAAIARIHTLMRTDATLVFRMYDVTDENPLASAVHDLFTVRAGGSLVYPEDALARLRHAGFDDTRELERDWDAPLRLVVGRRS